MYTIDNDRVRNRLPEAAAWLAEAIRQDVVSRLSALGLSSGAQDAVSVSVSHSEEGAEITVTGNTQYMRALGEAGRCAIEDAVSESGPLTVAAYGMLFR